jgi:hypothetical protein
LRKARDGKNAQRNGDDLLGDDPLADKKKSTASSPEAEGEDLFAENKKTRDTGEIEESSAGATSRDGEGNASAEEARNVNKDEKKAVIESTGDLLAKKSKTSDSMRKFLERRKQKKEIERAEAVASAGKPKMIEEEAAPGEKRSFLALFVAVSDSFGAASEKKMTGVLRALESSLDHCVAFFAEARSGDERFKVILWNSVEAGAEFPAENSHVEDIAGDAGKVMGHLVIRWSEPRTALAKDEAEAIQRAMLTLSPLASQWIKATRGEKAA